MAEKHYKEAVEAYSRAIQQDSSVAVYFANRCVPARVHVCCLCALTDPQSGGAELHERTCACHQRLPALHGPGRHLPQGLQPLGVRVSLLVACAPTNPQPAAGTRASHWASTRRR